MVTSRQMPERGMTLVEIMITLVISSIIAASTFMFFAGQQRIYETQTKVLNIQQNLWAAMEVLARYTRAAGTGMFGCVKPASYANLGPPIDGSRLRSTYPSPGPLTLPADQENLDTRPQTGVRAYDGSAGSATHMQWIPPLWIINNDAATAATDSALRVLAGTDIITVAFGNRTSGTDTDITLGSMLSTTDPGTAIILSGASTGSMFRAWEFVLLLKIPDWGYGADPTVDRGCTLFQITPPVQAAALLHQSGTGTDGSIWNPTENVPAMFPTDPITGLPQTTAYGSDVAGVRNFGALTWVTFFIQQVDASGTPTLMMQQRHLSGAAGAPQVLAEGIEDLQVSFACDTGTLAAHNLTALDGQLNEGADNPAHTNDAALQNDEWWNNVPGDVLPAMNTDGFCNLPTAVRITMVARSLAPDDLIDPISGNGPLDIEDHRQASPRPKDSFRRRVLTTTVYPRNNKPQ
jgi:prepilin-type N-terminal cleavage/methylation domain-containing protein